MSATLFANGRIVDVREGVTREAVVLVRDGRIASVDPGPPSPRRPEAGADTDAARGPEDVAVVDLGRRYLVPGLITAHAHPGLMEGFRNDTAGLDEARMRRDLRLWARFGVTTVQGLGTDRPFGFDVMRDRRPDEARYLTVGHGFGVQDGAPPLHIDPPGPYRVSDPGFIRDALRALRDEGASGVKIWFDDWYGQMPRMTADVARTVIETSAALGLRTYAHVYRVDDAKELVRLGIRTLAHMPRDRVADAELWSLMRERQVAVLPTLVVPDSNIVWLDRPAFLDDPLFQLAVGRDAPAFLRSDAFHASIRGKREFARLRPDLVDAMANVAGAYREGVQIGFGTDAGVSQRTVGYGEHRELELLTECGVPPRDAIRMATLGSAEVLGRDDRGEIAPGRLADLLVLREDPFEDVRALRTIDSVWIDGTQVAGALQP
ncbi:MAG TPA: amidohydrolase family protein [Candidatus Limnocylindria bacterium]|nr:amidohydrolase family protein [Candidatus Limnocylindria bacterium]